MNAAPKPISAGRMRRIERGMLRVERLEGIGAQEPCPGCTGENLDWRPGVFHLHGIRCFLKQWNDGSITVKGTNRVERCCCCFLFKSDVEAVLYLEYWLSKKVVVFDPPISDGQSLAEWLKEHAVPF